MKGKSALHCPAISTCNTKRRSFLLTRSAKRWPRVETDESQGQVEIDGCYVGGYVKPSNFKENRRDRRLAVNQNGKRQVVVIMRERNGRTLPFVSKSEAESSRRQSRVDANAIVHADEAAHWDKLHAVFLTKRINHEQAYSEGACTNQAESFFSRMRRAEIGQHHHIAADTSKPTLARWRGARITAASRMASNI